MITITWRSGEISEFRDKQQAAQAVLAVVMPSFVNPVHLCEEHYLKPVKKNGRNTYGSAKRRLSVKQVIWLVQDKSVPD